MKLKKKYKIILIAITVVFSFVLAVSTGYGLWQSLGTEDKDPKSITKNCFKIYYSNETNIIEMNSIKPVLNDDGRETSPYTVTVANTCDDAKEVQFRLNILNETNIDLDSLTLLVSGNLESDVMMYKNLKNAKTLNNNVSMSKLLGNIKVNSNETVRINLKLWFDEKKVNRIEDKALFKAELEVVDAATSVKPNFAEIVIADNEVKEEEIDYSLIANSDGGLYKILLGEEEYYFFRGRVNNNYVKFANQVWRIVSINENMSVKLVLDDNIGTSKYSNYRNAIDYTGLKYVYNGALIDNEINKFLNNWYTKNIIDTNLDKYVSDGLFCNDSSNRLEGYHKYFASYDKIVSNKTPNNICSETSEDFGGLIKQKIGLLTIDEVAMAGGVDGVNNTEFYLYKPYDYFTMSPAEYYGYNAYMFYVNGAGAILKTYTTDNMHIRPVINIHSTMSVEGKGTLENPYYFD